MHRTVMLAVLFILIAFTVSTVAVLAAPADHDTNDDDRIDFNEAWSALAKLRDGKITMVDAWDTIELYFTGGTVPEPVNTPTPTPSPTPAPTPTATPVPERCLPKSGNVGTGSSAVQLYRTPGGNYNNSGDASVTFVNPDGYWEYGFKTVWSSGIRFLEMKITSTGRWTAVLHDHRYDGHRIESGNLDDLPEVTFNSGAGETNTLRFVFYTSLYNADEPGDGYSLYINGGGGIRMPQTALDRSYLSHRDHYHDMIATPATQYRDLRKCR